MIMIIMMVIMIRMIMMIFMMIMRINLIISLPSEPGGRGAGLRKKRRSTLFVLQPIYHLANLHILMVSKYW